MRNIDGCRRERTEEGGMKSSQNVWINPTESSGPSLKIQQTRDSFEMYNNDV
jgi:hypothetical protein